MKCEQIEDNAYYVIQKLIHYIKYSMNIAQRGVRSAPMEMIITNKCSWNNSIFIPCRRALSRRSRLHFLIKTGFYVHLAICVKN